MLRKEKGYIPSDFSDDYLELVRLLTEGAGLEHSLMVAYLYAMFSLKESHHDIRGHMKSRSYLEHSPVEEEGTAVLRKKDTYLDVALEEMQHLSLVNWFLIALGASPNFMPHTFPFSSDLYPFDIELRSLDRYAVAAALWIEADDSKLSLGSESSASSEPA